MHRRSILDNDLDLSPLHAAGTLTCHPRTPPEETVARATGADAVIVNKVPMTHEVIGALPRLKHIAVIATGYNNVDLKAAGDAGVLVTNVGGYVRYTVPQHTFALILNLATRVHQYDRDVQSGAWARSPMFTLLTYPTFELNGKTIGIIGFGAIGRAVAKVAEAFGMNVMAHDHAELGGSGYRNWPLDEVIAQSDVVSLHCPLTDENRHMMNADSIAAMKPTALLINTAPSALPHDSTLVPGHR